MADPLNPAAWNRFAYVYNAPTNYVDPSGHFGFPLWDILDVGSFLSSANQYLLDPTLGNLFWLALDAIGLLPIIPSVGLLRHVDDVSEARRTAYLLGGAGMDREAIEQVVELSRKYERVVVADIHPTWLRDMKRFAEFYHPGGLPRNVDLVGINAAHLPRLSNADIFVMAPGPEWLAGIETKAIMQDNIIPLPREYRLSTVVEDVVGTNSTIWIASELEASAHYLRNTLVSLGFNPSLTQIPRGTRVGSREVLIGSAYFKDVKNYWLITVSR